MNLPIFVQGYSWVNLLWKIVGLLFAILLFFWIGKKWLFPTPPQKPVEVLQTGIVDSANGIVLGPAYSVASAIGGIIKKMF